MRNVLIFCFLTLAVAIQAQPQLLNKIVATVGNEYIMLSDVEEQMALSKERQGSLPPNYRCAIIDDLLTQKLLVHQAEIDSIAVTDVEIESQLQLRIDQILEYMGGDVAAFEEYYGQSVEKVKLEFREDLRNQLLSERMRGNIMANVNVTPAEVKTFFKNIPKDSLPYFNAEVELREIVYKPKMNADEKQKAYNTLFELRRRIVEGGENFELVASKNSMDGSARQGGDLGWAKRGKFVQEFEAAAYRLENLEVSPIIETEFGYHIIQTIERRGNMIHARHILIRPMVTEADNLLARETLDSVRTEIIRDSLSFSKAVKKFSDKNSPSFSNDGLMVNPNTGSTIFEIGDLDPDVYFSIEKLKPGEITAPIEKIGLDGSKSYYIVELMSRRPPHKANLQQDFAKIQMAALNQKKSAHIDDWVTRKVKNTYVSIDPMYQDCAILAKWRAVK